MLEGKLNYLSNLFVENITKLMSYKKTTKEHKIEVCQRINLQYKSFLDWVMFVICVSFLKFLIL